MLLYRMGLGKGHPLIWEDILTYCCEHCRVRLGSKTTLRCHMEALHAEHITFYQMVEPPGVNMTSTMAPESRKHTPEQAPNI